MSSIIKLPSELEAIPDKCFYPTGTFVESFITDVETSIPVRFEKIVRMYPGQIAVKMGGRSLTYAELNRYANRIAHAVLAKRGTSSEPIPLLLEHGVDMIPAILGVLKAGKFYLGLDRSFPEERQVRILEDSGAKLLLSNCRGEGLINPKIRGSVNLLNIDRLDESISSDNPKLSIGAEQPACLLYTSGSTGTPKGIVCPHKNIVFNGVVHGQINHIGVDDKLTLFHSIAFGSSHINLYQALLNGASIHPFDISLEGINRISSWLLDEQITGFHSTPAVFRQFVESISDRMDFPALRLINLSGAAVSKVEIDLYRMHFPVTTTFEISIGSTETHTFASFLIDQDFKLPEQGVPVGYCRPGREIFILDEDGNIVEPGQTGEITIRTRYLNLPFHLLSSTIQSSQDATESIYPTGDLGRMSPDGFVIHLGRKDLMVKIRGYRVELGEIERALLAHPEIKDVGVAAWNREHEEKYLVGYVVPRVASRLDVSDLNGFMRTRLPDYMIPSAFIFLDSLPLTNGKLDRKALPSPDDKRPELRTSYVTPRSDIDEQLVKIWEDNLNIRPIGIHDSFFDVGGDSLLAMRILSTVNDAFGVDVSIRNLLDAPTVAALADQIERQRATWDQTQTAKAYPPPSVTVPGAREGVLPLSYAEEGLWLIDQIQPGTTAWNMQSRFRLRGLLDTDVLTQSLNALVQRHEILRTAYQLTDGNPVRVITPFLNLQIPVTPVEVSLELNAAIERVSFDERSQAFNLAHVPLFRARLARINEQDHLLIVTTHHMITDAWSSKIFASELFALYKAFSKEKPSPLENLPIQYSDYALWVRQSAQEHMPEQLSYWRNKLAGCSAVEIPTDTRRTLEQTYHGAKESAELSRVHSRALWALCKKQRATRFMVLMAAFKLLLSRYTGANNVVVGSALAGRLRPELDNLIGMFVNILPLRTDLSGDATFRDLIQRVRETCMDAYQNQEMPFDKLVEEINPQRGRAGNPFFQVLFNVANLPSIPSRVDGLCIDSLARSDDTARFDLTISTREIEGRTQIVATYNRDIFSKEHIVEVLRQHTYVLEQIVEDPDRKIDQYSLLTSSAERLLPDPTLPLDDTWQGAVHELFAQHARRQPDKGALEDPFGVWTYKELNDLSNQVANYLLAQGIKRADVVAVHGQRSAVLVCALLGVLKAGAAFCVIDLSHPAGRIAEYLAVANPKALIELSGVDNPNALLEEVLNRVPLRCRITLRRPADAATSSLFLQTSLENPDITLGPDDLAYVIFTSGSTGRPKGVMGRHGPLTHFLPWLTETFGLSELDRFSFLSSIATNKLQREIFTALAIGATLYIPSDDTIGGFGTLDAWLREKEISTIHLTPAMAQLLDDTARQPVPSIRRVFFGGDLLQMHDVKRAKRLMPNAEIVNFYNSSEAQRGGAYFVFSDQELEHYKDIPPLGQGVKDVQLLILTQNGQRAGVGEQGEICVRSPHLARGYWGDEALTRDRFITNPYTGVESDRIYKTGELGRYLPDGSVEFVARAENQVSIRGFRVELGEIESALKKHPSIANAVVTLHHNSTDHLIAHLVVKREAVVSIDTVRAFLKATLPNFMIPAAFVFFVNLCR